MKKKIVKHKHLSGTPSIKSERVGLERIKRKEKRERRRLARDLEQLRQATKVDLERLKTEEKDKQRLFQLEGLTRTVHLIGKEQEEIQKLVDKRTESIRQYMSFIQEFQQEISRLEKERSIHEGNKPFLSRTRKRRQHDSLSQSLEADIARACSNLEEAERYKEETDRAYKFLINSRYRLVSFMQGRSLPSLHQEPPEREAIREHPKREYTEQAERDRLSNPHQEPPEPESLRERLKREYTESQPPEQGLTMRERASIRSADW